jgi:hypothetical protein
MKVLKTSINKKPLNLSRISISLLFSFVFFSLTVYSQPYSTTQGSLTKVNGIWEMQANGGADQVDTLTIILKASGNNEESMLNYVTGLGLTLEDTSDTGWDSFSIPPSTSFKTVYESLLSQSNVLEISINVYRQLLWSPNDPRYTANQQWYLDRIKADKAWDITKGCNTVTIAVIDGGIDLNHIDMGSGSGFDFIDNDTDPSPVLGDVHGTHVTGIVAAKTNNGLGIAGIAGGDNSEGVQIMALKVGSNNNLAQQDIIDAINYARNNGADILNMSFGSPTNSSPAELSAIRAAYNAGIVLIAGSGSSGSQGVWYPAALKEVIAVGATTHVEQRLSTSDYSAFLLALSAPGQGILSTVPGDAYTNSGGTSMATPMVSGTAALMQCVNPCLSPLQFNDIFRESIDRVGGYNYGKVNSLILPPYDDVSEELGHGRLDAEKAVAVANGMQSSSVDLYIKDRFEDFGYPNSYLWGWYFDNSPDIWLRNKRDLNNRYGHQSPSETQGNSYVYVIVRNKSCANFTGTGSTSSKLHLYWSLASSVSSWPQNWDGTNPNIGDEIGSGFNIPAIPAGSNVVVEVPWDFSSTPIAAGNNVCLLARIENAPDEGITVYPNELHRDVYENGNIAMKNLTVVLNKKGSFSEREVPPGGTVFIGNPNQEFSGDFDIRINETPWLNEEVNVFAEAEVCLQIDQNFWDAANQSPNLQFNEIHIINDNTLRFESSNASITGLHLSPGQRIQTYLSTSFLAEFAENTTSRFTLHLAQYNAANDDLLGAVHYDILRTPFDGFEADAGPDQEIYDDESTTLVAKSINEPATYNWYAQDSLVASGNSLVVQPNKKTTYNLEVISDSSNFKDYDMVEVKVKHRWITSLNPNPASDLVIIGLNLPTNSQNVSININNFNGVNVLGIIVSTSANQASMDVTALPAGIYTLSVLANGTVAESRILVIQ